MAVVMGLVLVWACGDPAGPSTHPAFEVVADDGSATLRIAESSLPEGVSPEHVAIRRLAADEGILATENLTPIAAWELSPDGTVLAAPATLELRPAVPLDGALLATHESRNGIEGLEPRDVAITAGLLESLTVDVEHFSTARLSDAGRFTAARFSVRPNPTVVGGGVGVVVRAELATNAEYHGYSAADDEGILGTEVRMTLDLGSGWSATSLFLGSSNLTPRDVHGAGLETGSTQPVLFSTGGFVCVSPGTMTVEASVSATYRAIGVRGDYFWNGDVVSVSDSAPCIAPWETDAIGDQLDSVSTQKATYTDASIDIESGSATSLEMTPERNDLFFGNTIYECGVLADGARTVCTAAPLPFPDGEAWVLTTTLAAPISDDATHSRIYAAVFDSDGDAANDWRFVPPYDFDIFQATDRWYQLVWDHRARTWSVRVTQVDAAQAQNDDVSAARAVIRDDTITWYVPKSELPSASPGYRLTSFGHVDFDPANRGADVTGVDPTEPLRVPREIAP